MLKLRTNPIKSVKIEKTHRTAISLNAACVEAVQFNMLHKLGPIIAKILATIGTHQLTGVCVDSCMCHVRASKGVFKGLPMGKWKSD